MSSNQENDDDSFILILGTSPDASMNTVKCNGSVNGDILQKSQIEDAMKDLPEEANLAFKAQFHIGESPSPASLMVASTLITDDRSTEELQKRFGELLDENVVLKETLRQNNESMKEQFMLIASCQEDMLKTHKLHREKFDETRELVEKLRKENKQLKMDISRASDIDAGLSLNNETGESKTGPPSAVEFVSSPEDDVVDKLTAQLELVEKQRRQVIVENEKLTWQKESLEHIVDATSKERDDLKEKLRNAELVLSSKDTEQSQEVDKLHVIIGDLQTRLAGLSASPEELRGRDERIRELQARLAALTSDLKVAQLRVLDLENVKLEFSRHKAGAADAIRAYKEQVLELRDRIKAVQTTVFQPVRVSLGSEAEGSECASYMANVRMYDRTLAHLADHLNGMVNGLTDSLVQTLGVMSSLSEMNMDRASSDTVRAGLGDVKATLEKQHSATVSFMSNIRGTLSIFEGIFKDYNELLKKSLTKTDTKPPDVEQLTSALLARAQEVSLLREQVDQLAAARDEATVLRAQLDLYKSDFEAERESREKMASEKDAVETDLRTAQKRVQELTAQLAEARKKPLARTKPAASQAAPTRPSTATSNVVYTCPKCTRFSSTQYEAMEEHFDFCLDDF